MTFVLILGQFIGHLKVNFDCWFSCHKSNDKKFYLSISYRSVQDQPRFFYFFYLIFSLSSTKEKYF